MARLSRTVAIVALLGALIAWVPGGGPFSDLGFGLPGNFGLVPQLTGTGTPTPGETLTFTVSKCAKSSLAYLVIGTHTIQAPLLGGVLVPDPRLVLGPVETRKGLVVTDLSWPPTLGPGMPLFLQWWVLDGQAVEGYSASNALQVLP